MEFDAPAPVNQNASLSLTAIVSGLSPGVTYTCSVAAMNDRGEGERTEESGTTQERGQCWPCNSVWLFILNVKVLVHVDQA